MNEAVSDLNDDCGIDQWINAAVHGVRQYSYQLGRLFNRFCFHFDQAYALAYRFREASTAQLQCAVSAFRDIETLVQKFDPARADRRVPLIEFRERIEDANFLRSQFEDLRDRCSTRGAEPEFDEILWLTSRERASLPNEVLQAIDHGDKPAFQVGFVLDQAIRPPQVMRELYLATVAGDVWPKVSPQPVRVGDVRPEPSWQGTLATWLAELGCEIPAPSMKDDIAEWSEVINQLDHQIRQFCAPATFPKKSRLTVVMGEKAKAVWNGEPFPLNSDSAMFLSTLIEFFDDPRRNSHWVSSTDVKNRWNLDEFRSTPAKNALPKELRQLVETKPRTGSRLKDCVA